MPDSTTTTTLPGGGSVAFDPTALAGQTAPAQPAQPSALPTEILGSQSFDTNTTTDAQGHVTGGPGLWTVNTGDGRTARFNDQAKKLYSLTPAEVEQLQVALYQGGYYDDSIYKQHANPSWGQADTATQDAYYQALLDAARHPEQTLEQRMTSAQDLNRDRLAKLQTTGSVIDLKPDVVSLSQINLSDPATLRAVARSAGQALTGKDLSDDEVSAFADQIRGKQRSQGEAAQAQQRSAAEQQAAIDKDHAITAAKGPQAATAELDAFKKVMTNEIVGPISAFAATPALGTLQAKLNQYGIDSSTMAKWAEDARKDGVAVPSLSSPQAVDIVVDHHVKALYGATGGDWNSVATYFLADVDKAMKASRGGLGYGATGLPVYPGAPARTGPGVGTTGMPTAPSGFAGIDDRAGVSGSGRLIPGSAGASGAQRQTTAQGVRPHPGAAPNGADTYGGGSTPGPVEYNTGAGQQALAPLASHVTTSMGQMLGQAIGSAAGGVTGDNAPVFTGGGEQTAIDPAAEAQEQVKRDHPDQVLDYAMMGNLRILDQLLGGGRG